jgi:hypothetical protein
MLAHFFIAPQKRRVQPERYTPLIFELIQKTRGVRAALEET